MQTGDYFILIHMHNCNYESSTDNAQEVRIKGVTIRIAVMMQVECESSVESLPERNSVQRRRYLTYTMFIVNGKIHGCGLKTKEVKYSYNAQNQLVSLNIPRRGNLANGA